MGTPIAMTTFLLSSFTTPTVMYYTVRVPAAYHSPPLLHVLHSQGTSRLSFTTPTVMCYTVRGLATYHSLLLLHVLHSQGTSCLSFTTPTACTTQSGYRPPIIHHSYCMYYTVRVPAYHSSLPLYELHSRDRDPNNDTDFNMKMSSSYLLRPLS